MEKHLVQEHASGCGVAVTAQVANITYKKALGLFHDGEFRAELRGFYCREIIRSLRKKELNYRFFYLTRRNRRKIYKNKAIVYIKKSRKYPQGHYISRSNNLWIDPWINYPSIINTKSGTRRRLPGKPIYVILPII